MKYTKQAAYSLALAALLTLGGCASSGTENDNPPAPGTEEAAETAPLSAEEKMELAKTLLDAPVEDLIAKIGEPESRDYAPSCFGDGEDGNLYYDGFVVYTYREGGKEVVRDVDTE